MADRAIPVPSGTVHLSALGLNRYAAHFLRAEASSSPEEGFSPVPYYLCCHSIELSLKAFLLASSDTTNIEHLDELKKELKHGLGHDLEAAFRRAESQGIRNVVQLPNDVGSLLRTATEYYKTKGFEYFSVVDAVSGYRDLPSLDELRELASVLVEQVDPICWEASKR